MSFFFLLKISVKFLISNPVMEEIYSISKKMYLFNQQLSIDNFELLGQVRKIFLFYFNRSNVSK